ncbi:MAPEG family protein [Ferrimonas sp. SCSIO 43195]|nr:MAPEG family protein [Ferrimonas sp. SCSIO 43195]
MAWSYVVLRVIHSLVQALGNRIEVRFAVFVLSNLPLLVLTVVAITKLR